MTDPVSVLQAWLGHQRQAPRITYIDRLEQRTELSAATLANGAAKAAWYFADELMAEPGQVVLLHCRLHWQVPVLLLGSWWAGLTVRLPGGRPDDRAGVAEPLVGVLTDSPSASRLAPDVPGAALLQVSRHPWGLPLGPALAPGAVDLAAQVRMQPDEFEPRWPAGGQPWLVGPDGPLAGPELAGAAEALARAWGLDRGGRLAVPAQAPPITQALATTLVPALRGAAALLLDRVPAGSASRILAQEHVSAQVPE